MSSILLFQEYHLKYPSHGYRWLKAKICLDHTLALSDAYAHKCCKAADIKSGVRHRKYKKSGEPYKVFPNLLMSEMNIDGPLQCIVSDMTALRVKGVYYELTLYMDLWNNEIVSHSLSAKRGDRMTYISGLNDLLAMYNVTRSMSRAGTPTDNAAMEAINGWIKAELFADFHVTGNDPVNQEIDDYILFFNQQRPAYSLNYLTPLQYRERFAPDGFADRFKAGGKVSSSKAQPPPGAACP